MTEELEKKFALDAEEMAEKYAKMSQQAPSDLGSTMKKGGEWNPQNATSYLGKAMQALDLPGRMTQLIFQAISCTPCVQKPLFMLATYLNSPLNPTHTRHSEHSEICLFLPVTQANWVTHLQNLPNPPALPQVPASPSSKERLRVRVEDMF